MTIGWNDLSSCITDNILICNKDSLGQNSVYICFFIISPYFLKFSSVLMDMQISLVMVERLFLAVPRGSLQFVIVVFPDHTHLLF